MTSYFLLSTQLAASSFLVLLVAAHLPTTPRRRGAANGAGEEAVGPGAAAGDEAVPRPLPPPPGGRAPLHQRECRARLLLLAPPPKSAAPLPQRDRPDARKALLRAGACDVFVGGMAGLVDLFDRMIPSRFPEESRRVRDCIKGHSILFFGEPCASMLNDIIKETERSPNLLRNNVTFQCAFLGWTKIPHSLIKTIPENYKCNGECHAKKEIVQKGKQVKADKLQTTEIDESASSQLGSHKTLHGDGLKKNLPIYN
ncbi:hypothetical protein ACP4OV_014912 [Aristida adscensionis]